MEKLRFIVAISLISITLNSVAQEDGLTVFTENGKQGVRNEKGTAIIRAQYEEIDIWMVQIDGFIRVRQNSKWGFFDISGKQLSPVMYDAVAMFVGGLCAVRQGDKWGFINSSNQMVIPLQYDSFDDNDAGYPYVYCFNGYGLAAVKKNGKWGFINRQNSVVVPFKYDDVLYSAIGDPVMACVEINGETMFIDKDGKEIDRKILFGD